MAESFGKRPDEAQRPLERQCRSVQDLLPLYVSEELPARRTREIGLHLESCGSCREEFEAYCGVRYELQTYRDETVDDVLVDFVSAVEDRVHAEEPDLQRERATGQWRTRQRRAPILGRLGLDGSGMNWRTGASWGGAIAAMLALGLWLATPGGGASDGVTIDSDGAQVPAVARVLDEPADMNGMLGKRLVPYNNPGRPSREVSRSMTRPVSTDSVRILAGPGLAIDVSVPQQAVGWPVAPVPKIRPYPYRGRGPVSGSSLITH